MLDFTLDSKDFPPMQTTSKNILADATTTEHTNQSKQNEATNQHITPMNLDNNLATSTNPRSSNIDVAALQQMIIQNIKGEINKRIQMQIQQEMALLKIDCSILNTDFNKKHNTLAASMAQLQSPLATLVSIMSSPKNRGDMK